MTRYVLSLMVAMVLAVASATHARTCNPAIPATAPDSRYTNHGDGTVSDNVTGLMWKKCSEGQSYNDGTCTGSVTYHTWSEPLNLAEGATYAGHGDWRLPDVKELASLVEERCYDPAINDTLFPTTSSDWFWSSSPFAGDSDFAWIVYFFNGDVSYYSSRGYEYAVRLVRGGQWFGSWDQPVISADPSEHSFADTDVGNSSVAQTFTITNAGTEVLEIGVVGLTEDGVAVCQAMDCPTIDPAAFTIVSDTCSNQNMAPSGACTVEASFVPGSAGDKVAALYFLSNDPENSPLYLPLWWRDRPLAR